MENNRNELLERTSVQDNFIEMRQILATGKIISAKCRRQYGVNARELDLLYVIGQKPDRQLIHLKSAGIHFSKGADVISLTKRGLVDKSTSQKNAMANQFRLSRSGEALYQSMLANETNSGPRPSDTPESSLTFSPGLVFQWRLLQNRLEYLRERIEKLAPGSLETTNILLAIDESSGSTRAQIAKITQLTASAIETYVSMMETSYPDQPAKVMRHAFFRPQNPTFELTPYGKEVLERIRHLK